jgi:hypothetical protein
MAMLSKSSMARAILIANPTRSVEDLWRELQRDNPHTHFSWNYFRGIARDLQRDGIAAAHLDSPHSRAQQKRFANDSQ